MLGDNYKSNNMKTAAAKQILSSEEERELIELLLSMKEQLKRNYYGKDIPRKSWLVIQTVAVDAFLAGRERTTNPRLWVATLRGEDLTFSDVALEIEGARKQEGGKR